MNLQQLQYNEINI